MTLRFRFALVALPLALAGCGSQSESSISGQQGGAPGGDEETVAYSGIGPEETIHFTGTEPFWGGEASGGTLTYSTPENIEGTAIAVERFTGNNGLSLSGRLDQAPFDMAITPGECSDGMSDRTYPFAVTLQVRGEQRHGCAWTDGQSFTGPEQP